MESKQLKGHGYVRKSKAAGLVCGIVLGAALFAGVNSASADEVTATPAPATTAESSAPKAQGQAQESTVTVDEGLTDAVTKAKAAGLTVEQEATKDLGTATTEDQVKQFDDAAKKEVAAQKAEIEQKAADYAAAVTSAEKARKTVVDSVAQNPLLYYAASSQLNDAADVDFNNGKASFGDFSSSKGSVTFLNAPNSVELNLSGMKSVVGSAAGQMKEITTYYAQGDMFSGNTSVADKKNAKVVPISISQGETITYKVNYAADSELGKLGVAYVEKKITLVKSPVKNGKTVLLADRYGSVSGNFVIGGTGNANNDVLNIGDWSYEFTKTYYDKSGKVIDSKELTANVFNKYAFGGKDVMKASDIQLAVSPQNRDWTIHNGSDADLSQKKSLTGVYGGEAFLKSTLVETVTQRDSSAINPHGHEMFYHSQKLQQADVSGIGVPAKPSVKYHLVSYKKAVKSTLPGDNATGSVEVHYVKDDAAKTVLKEPVTDIDHAKVGTKYDTTDNKPKTITKDGKEYQLVRTEGKETGEVVEGKIVVTYIYRETVKPTTIHVDGGGKELTPPEDGTKPFAKIPGYEPDPENPRNNEDPNGETVRVYKKVTPKPTPAPVEKMGSVEVHYVKDDAAKTVLKEPVTDIDHAKVGTKYDTTDNKPKTITKDGKEYQLVRTEGKETGEVVEGKIVVTYIYRETVKPTTIHVDGGGKELTPPEDGTKPFAKIPGYEPDPENPRNNEDPNGVTVRVYKKVTPKPTPVPVNDPTTIHIDRDGKEIAPKEKGTKGFKKIPGYEADPTSLLNKEDPKGQSVRVYRKVEPKVDPKENPVTIHIDTEGKTVAPKEDGTKGFKEIPGYEKYPEDPKNVENVNGITVRVYKKLEDKPVQPTTPAEPAQPSPAAPATQKLSALPETGTATSILSVVGAALGGLGVVGLKSRKDEE
ncbi:MucBP domain-containing protein [Streptococcus cristatus]|uniref:MucBP domain-containing protein n=1 Tax=Streptococcus cristatus TaxID=45634 RepID=UPI0028D350CE|nr:MucBP domain-containing protein [Streptococcus cristatus]